MIGYSQHEQEFYRVAHTQGFDRRSMHVYKNMENTLLAHKSFGTGFKLLQMNRTGLFKISGCVSQEGDIKDGYYQTDWISFDTACAFDVSGL